MRRVLIFLIGCIALQSGGSPALAAKSDDEVIPKGTFGRGFPFEGPGIGEESSSADESESENEETASQDGEAAAPEEDTSGKAAAAARRVTSTAYCHTGAMASGKSTYDGAVAMNDSPLGSRYEVLNGPRAGETFVVEDRIASGSAFDIAYPGDCQAARQYGRRTIGIRRV